MSATASSSTKLGRHHDLADLAPPGEQQLTHGLASLHLLATETLGATRRVQVTSAGHPAPARAPPVLPAACERGTPMRVRAERPGTSLAPVGLRVGLAPVGLRAAGLALADLPPSACGAAGLRRLGLRGAGLAPVGLAPVGLRGAGCVLGSLVHPGALRLVPFGGGAPMSRRPCLMVRLLEDSRAHETSTPVARVSTTEARHSDALAAPERAEALGPAPLHADRSIEHGAEAALHLGAPRRQLGRLAHHRTVGVADRPPLGAHPLDHLRQQPDRVGAGPFGGRCRGTARRDRRARPLPAARRRRRGPRRRRRCGRRARAGPGTRSRRAPAAGRHRRRRDGRRTRCRRGRRPTGHATRRRPDRRAPTRGRRAW